MREGRKGVASIFIVIFAGAGIKYFMSPQIKIENKFKKTFKENTNFYVLNKILTNKEKENLIYSLNSESFTEKERVISIIEKEKKDEISKIGELGKEEIKKKFLKDEKEFKFTLGGSALIVIISILMLIL